MQPFGDRDDELRSVYEENGANAGGGRFVVTTLDTANAPFPFETEPAR